MFAVISVQSAHKYSMKKTDYRNLLLTDTPAKKWNQIYQERLLQTRVQPPAQVLADCAHLLPASGRALDLACGRGGNAMFLAEHGLQTWAWDISETVLEQLTAQVTRAGLKLHTEVKDIENTELPVACFEVIVVSFFLNRSICESIIKMLTSDGLLFYQTYTVDALKAGIGPTNPDYLLHPNELIKLFDGLQLHAYREDCLIPEAHKNNLQGQAYLVARKIDS